MFLVANAFILIISFISYNKKTRNFEVIKVAGRSYRVTTRFLHIITNTHLPSTEKHFRYCDTVTGVPEWHLQLRMLTPLLNSKTIFLIILILIFTTH